MGEVQIRLQNINTDGDSAVLREEMQDDIRDNIQENMAEKQELQDSIRDNIRENEPEDQADESRKAAAGPDGTSTASESDSGAEPATETEEPDDDTLVAAMESILFAMGDAVPVNSIAAALGVSRERTLQAADALSERCRLRSSGVSLNWYEDSIQLSTKPELYDYLIRIASEPKKPKLTPTLLETLSIIAYRQPVTRMEVENIRGVNSDFAINRLVSYDLVQEVGRKEVPGRPLLFGTTQQFLRSFGIRSVEELPEPDSSHMESFREEAEEEVSSKLDI